MFETWYKGHHIVQDKNKRVWIIEGSFIDEVVRLDNLFDVFEYIDKKIEERKKR